MRPIKTITLFTLLLGLAAAQPLAAADHDHPSDSAAEPALKLENLLSAELEGFAGGEVIVSRVTIPPHTSLPKHWHPGEEFAYILEGSAVLWQEGKEEIVGRAGDVLKVPLEQVHTALTRDEGAVILVFRVHEQGKPERVPVE
jgi:quercetin dioxygenase-like cupin family protein